MSMDMENNFNTQGYSVCPLHEGDKVTGEELRKYPKVTPWIPSTGWKTLSASLEPRQ
jgi:hypothetical protein